jgi:hypothetical protein
MASVHDSGGKASKKRELKKEKKEAIRAFENMGFLKEKKV